MNEEKYKKERIEYIADKISPYTVAGCDEDLAQAIFNLVEEENARLKDKIKKGLEELNKTDYEYSSRTEYANIIMNTKEILKEN